MTDRQINIAIAEACGIVDVDHWGPLYKTPSGWVRDCPDYCNDLNAMHEAEKVLNPKQLLDMEDTVDSRFAVVPFHSTARERAESFLRTIGKWEEVQP